MTNPPFMREKGKPPYHLRESTPAELEQHRRMVDKQEALRIPPVKGQDELQRLETL